MAKKPFAGYNASKHSKSGGLNDKYREKLNRETGSNLKRPVTKKAKEGSEAEGRRKSFCARMAGNDGPLYKYVDSNRDGKKEKLPTPKLAALRRWACKNFKKS